MDLTPTIIIGSLLGITVVVLVIIGVYRFRRYRHRRREHARSVGDVEAPMRKLTIRSGQVVPSGARPRNDLPDWLDQETKVERNGETTRKKLPPSTSHQWPISKYNSMRQQNPRKRQGEQSRHNAGPRNIREVVGSGTTRGHNSMKPSAPAAPSPKVAKPPRAVEARRPQAREVRSKSAPETEVRRLARMTERSYDSSGPRKNKSEVTLRMPAIVVTEHSLSSPLWKIRGKLTGNASTETIDKKSSGSEATNGRNRPSKKPSNTSLKSETRSSGESKRHKWNPGYAIVRTERLVPQKQSSAIASATISSVKRIPSETPPPPVPPVPTSSQQQQPAAPPSALSSKPPQSISSSLAPSSRPSQPALAPAASFSRAPQLTVSSLSPPSRQPQSVVAPSAPPSRQPQPAVSSLAPPLRTPEQKPATRVSPPRSLRPLVRTQNTIRGKHPDRLTAHRPAKLTPYPPTSNYYNNATSTSPSNLRSVTPSTPPANSRQSAAKRSSLSPTSDPPSPPSATANGNPLTTKPHSRLSTMSFATVASSDLSDSSYTLGSALPVPIYPASQGLADFIARWDKALPMLPVTEEEAVSRPESRDLEKGLFGNGSAHGNVVGRRGAVAEV